MMRAADSAAFVFACRRLPTGVRHARLQIQYLAGYAPELNADEGVWKQALANGSADTLGELAEHMRAALEAIRRSPARLRTCIHASDLLPFLP